MERSHQQLQRPTPPKKNQKKQQQLPLVTNCALKPFDASSQPQQLLEGPRGAPAFKKTSQFAVNVWLLFTQRKAKKPGVLLPIKLAARAELMFNHVRQPRWKI